MTDHRPGDAARKLRANQFILAAVATEKAIDAARRADPLDPDHTLAVKNITAGALSATQAWMTSQRPR